MSDSRLVSCEFRGLPLFRNGQATIPLPDGQLIDNHCLNTVLPITGLNNTGKTMLLRLLALADGIINGFTRPNYDALRPLTFYNKAGFPYRITVETDRQTTVRKGSSPMFWDWQTITRSLHQRDNFIALMRSEDYRGLSQLQPDIELIRMFIPDAEQVSYDPNSNSVTLIQTDGSVHGNIDDNWIATGATRGLNILVNTQKILKTGGLMLVDDLENNLHRQIVKTIFNLFRSPRTNPRHAILAFTTHCPELLDHVPEASTIVTVRREDGVHVKLVPPTGSDDRSRAAEYEANMWDGTTPFAKKYCEVLFNRLAS